MYMSIKASKTNWSLELKNFALFCRWSLLQHMNSVLEEGSKLSPEALDAYCSVLAVSAGNLPRATRHPPLLNRSALPAPLKTVLDNWNANTMTDFPAAHAWVSTEKLCGKPLVDWESAYRRVEYA